jgi:hypothetical protein
MSLDCIDLMMDNGELVRIETPTNHFDAVYESLDNCRKRGDMWSCAQYDGVHATYMGLHIERVNMARVMGYL